MSRSVPNSSIHLPFERGGRILLDGMWEYAIVSSGLDELTDTGAAQLPAHFDGKIRVPFSPETEASGVGRQLQPGETLCYRRQVALPELGLRERLVIHFGAVDWRCVCFVGGSFVGEHAGGYEPFAFDVTDALRVCGAKEGGASGQDVHDAKETSASGRGVHDAKETGASGQDACVAKETGASGLVEATKDQAHDQPSFELLLCVEDPSDAGGQPRGKQRREVSDIWYPPQSGIWQSVWMEVVPDAHVADVSLKAELRQAPAVEGKGDASATGFVSACVQLSRPGRMLRASLRREGQVVATASRAAVACTSRLTLELSDPELWSPEHPALYELELRYGSDALVRRCAFRTTVVRPDAAGIPRFHLNGTPLMLRGLLYQPYWQGSLMTPPDVDALRADLELARELGFNLVRVHAAIMGEEFYELCDELGMLVCQDLVPGAMRKKAKELEDLPPYVLIVRHVLMDSGPLARVAERFLRSDDGDAQQVWLDEACRAVERLRRHPSIVMWTIFNEGWGQFETERVLRVLSALDPTRPFDAASGWYDVGVGDFDSVHDYTPELTMLRARMRSFRRRRRLLQREGTVVNGILRSRIRPTEKETSEDRTFAEVELREEELTSPGRALLLSECGGLTLRVEGHAPAGETFGYEECADAEDLARSLAALRTQLEGLWDAGLAGYIYTQLCDVEQECNGLVTYDRAVRKVAVLEAGARTVASSLR